MSIGTKIRDGRNKLGLTQTEFGEVLGVKKNAVSKWEVGRVEDIPVAKIKKMASLFGVRPSYLIDDDSVGPAHSEEAEKIAVAFDGADQRTKEIVRLSLLPYMEESIESSQARGATAV